MGLIFHIHTFLRRALVIWVIPINQYGVGTPLLPAHNSIYISYPGTSPLLVLCLIKTLELPTLYQ